MGKKHEVWRKSIKNVYKECKPKYIERESYMFHSYPIHVDVNAYIRRQCPISKSCTITLLAKH